MRRLNTVAPDIQAEIIANAGHDLSLVQADRVNTLVFDFLMNE